MAFNELLVKASNEQSQLKRLALVATWAVVGNLTIVGRTDKPFNPMLGETFELVSPKYRFISELVSHHPPILAMNCQGQGYEISQTIVSKMAFTGKNVQV